MSPTAVVRDPKILIDAEYTAKIKEHMTQPSSARRWWTIPASKTVPTPKAVIPGDIAGAPGKRPTPKRSTACGC
jgi:hypothetical protein